MLTLYYGEHQPFALVMHDAPPKKVIAKLRAQVQNLQKQITEMNSALEELDHENRIAHRSLAAGSHGLRTTGPDMASRKSTVNSDGTEPDKSTYPITNGS